MNYELRHFDTPLLRFIATEDSNMPDITITWQNNEEKQLLPLDLEATPEMNHILSIMHRRLHQRHCLIMVIRCLITPVVMI